MRVLFVTLEYVWPAERGGRVRTLAQLKLLASLPEVTSIDLVSLREDDVAEEDLRALEKAVPKLSVRRPVFHPIHLFAHKAYVPRVALLRAAGVPYVAGKWDHPRIRRELKGAVRLRQPDVVWLDHLGVARYLPLLRRHVHGARFVLDQHNVESDIFKQFAERKKGLVRLVATREWRLAERFEVRALRAVDAVSAISDGDRDAFKGLSGVEAIVVPQVVSFERRPKGPDGKRARFLYVGNLAWHPNAAGLDWFFEAVWPRVREELPHATLDVVGSGLAKDASGKPKAPASWLLPGVTVTGFAPRLKPHMDQADAMVAPIRGGSGVRIKLLEAFKGGLPTVTTKDGAAGLAVEAGRDVLIEDDPAAFASAMARLANDPQLRRRLRDRAYDFLAEHHSLKVAQGRARRLLASVDR